MVRMSTGIRRSLALIFGIIIVLCCTFMAVLFLVDSVNDAIAARDEYRAAQQELSAARQNKQELQVLIDMYKEDPNAFMEYVAGKNGYIKDGDIIFDINGN